MRADLEKGLLADGFPKRALLVNPIMDNTYAMRLLERIPLEWTAEIDTPARGETEAPRRIKLEGLSLNVTEAALFLRPYARLVEPTEAKHEKRLQDAKISVWIDGERTLDRLPLGQLRRFATPFAKPTMLFYGRMCGEEGTPIGDETIGLFLPNGVVVELELAGIPGGMGRAKIKLGCVLARYTTKL